ncbi:MAG: Transcriptional regulator, liaR family [Marmoricola sp.]|nr:Transcriptional regulator, liaR family [Marmoricola sp.]
MHYTLSRAELNEIAASAEPITRRAAAFLEKLHRVVRFDGAWLAVADPVTHAYTSLGSKDLDRSTLSYLGGPRTARDIERTGANRARHPVSPSDRPYPVEEIQTWADCLLPAGYRESLCVALFAPGGRHVGLLSLLSSSREPASPAARRRLGAITAVLSKGVDPMRSMYAATGVVQGATAGVVVRVDGATQPLPGLDGHSLLARDSPVVEAAWRAIRAGDVYRSFLWPLGGRHAPGGHVRVTVLGTACEVPELHAGMVVLSPLTQCRGLTPRELEVLGHLVQGHSNREIARRLVLAQRTVASHVEHILVKFDASTRTLAAVRADREGLYVPLAHSRTT